MSDQVLFEKQGGWGVITLNRPEALNALTIDMARAMDAQLRAWEDDPALFAVIVRGAGDRAFCAGGDIRWLHDTAKDDPVAAAEFFRVEYTLDALIHHYSKPYVAIIDGVVMGGGVGLSVHGDFRVAGDRTLFAMPETGIGLFPDVGGGYFLPRLEGGVGLYFALTGARAKASDLVEAKIATQYIPTSGMDAAIADLLALAQPGKADIHAVLTEHADVPDDGTISALRPDIERLFVGHRDLEELLHALKIEAGAFAEATLETLQKVSPTSVALTWKQFHDGAEMSFDDVMRTEFRVASRLMENGDFFEGVRAQIIDKDRNPKWGPTQAVAGYFAPFEDPERELAL